MGTLADVVLLFVEVIYNLSWLVFLTKKHYGQVTTKAGHIFELNVLVNYILYSLLMILLVDLEVLPWGTMSEILQTMLFFNYLLAVAGSQIEAVIFLKTLDVNTMMTNTAGKIIAAMTFCSLGLAITITLAKPSWNVNERKTEYCEFVTPKAFYRTTLPSTVPLVIVLAVIGFAVYRSHQVRKISDNEDHVGDEGEGHQLEMESRDTLNVSPYQERLFTVQEVISDLYVESRENCEGPAGIIENDVFIEDIELGILETPELNQVSEEIGENIENVVLETPELNPDLEETGENIENVEDELVVNVNESPCSMEELSIGGMIQEMNQLNELNSVNTRNHIAGVLENNWCLPAGTCISQTVNKYLKNSLISLLILTCELPWYLTNLYGFISNSGCENPALKILSEVSVYLSYSYILLPYLIKIKLDRLSH